MPKGRDIGSAFEKRRGEVERIGNAQAQVFRVNGEIEVDGVGEFAVTVDFPCLFVDKPEFSFGPELGPGQPVVQGQFPECDCVISQWQSKVRDDGTVIYAGATFCIVTNGPVGQVMLVQYHMEGVGLQGPVPNE